MKSTMKKIAAIVMAAVLMLALTACGGVDLSKMKGDWTVTKANDTSYADYATSIGGTADTMFMNLTITDKEVTLTGASDAQTYTYKQKANGIDLYIGDTLAGSIELKSDGTLGYSLDLGFGTANCIFEKGTYTPTPAEEESIADDSEEIVDDTADEAFDEEADAE